MALESTIMEDMKAAMKAKDKVALRGIRAIKSAIQLAKTDGTNTELDEAGEIKMLQKLAKQREDSLDIYIKQNREDLAQVEREELAVIKKYLPAQMSADELKPLIQEIISSTGASGMKDMGKVMGMASAKLAGKSDGKTISSIVKELLT
jgi:uncharacterized protein YqeY